MHSRKAAIRNVWGEEKMREKALAALRRVGVPNNGLSGENALDPCSRSDRRLVAISETALAASSSLWATMVIARLRRFSFSRNASGRKKQQAGLAL